MTNPGSPDAVALGCTCPVGENNNGEGTDVKGELVFVMVRDCPVHDAPR